MYNTLLISSIPHIQYLAELRVCLQRLTIKCLEFETTEKQLTDDHVTYFQFLEILLSSAAF